MQSNNLVDRKIYQLYELYGAGGKMTDSAEEGSQSFAFPIARYCNCKVLYKLYSKLFHLPKKPTRRHCSAYLIFEFHSAIKMLRNDVILIKTIE